MITLSNLTYYPIKACRGFDDALPVMWEESLDFDFEAWRELLPSLLREVRR